jgi:hypothetical protein
VLLALGQVTGTLDADATAIWSLAILGVLILVALLIQKELANSSTRSDFKRFGKFLNIGIVPLFIAFLLIIIIRLAGLLK